jgi:cysteine synthase
MSMSDVLDIRERPDVIEIWPRLHAILFNPIKLVVARHLLRHGIEIGVIDHRTHVFESSSGSMALALAFACREVGLPLTIVGDDAIDAELHARLEVLGACVSLVRGPFAVGGAQGARIQRLRELMAQTEGAFWPRQYDNSAAREAYLPIADELCARLGHIDILVVSVGTGASACGLIQGIRGRFRQALLVAVDTHGSVLFGQRDAPRTLRGLGNSLLPGNLIHELVDECHWVTTGEAFLGTRDLYRGFAVDAGPTSGAAFLVASWLARRNETSRVVFVGADTGERYRSTVLDERWLRARGLWCSSLPPDPILVSDPRRCPAAWCRIEWNRRRLSEVVPETRTLST